jgi:hypothetical protein
VSFAIAHFTQHSEMTAIITEGQVKIMNEALAGADQGRNKVFAGGDVTPAFKATGKPNTIEVVLRGKDGADLPSTSTDSRGITIFITLPVTTVVEGYIDVEKTLKWKRSSKEDRAPTQSLKLSLAPTDPRLASSLPGLGAFKTFGFDGLISAWFEAKYAPTSTLKKQLAAGDEEKYRETMGALLMDTGMAPFGCVSETDTGELVGTFRSKVAPYSGETTAANKEIIEACDITSEVAMFAEETDGIRKQFVELINVDGTKVSPEEYCDRARTMCEPGSLVTATVMVFFGGITTYEGKQSFKPKLVSIQAVETAAMSGDKRGPTNLLDALAKFKAKEQQEQEKQLEEGTKKKKPKVAK